MTPPFARSNPRNLRVADTKSVRYFPLGDARDGSYFHDLFLSQLMQVVGFSGLRATPRSALLTPVSGVVRVSAKPQVSGIHASAIIPTRAVMKNKQPVRDGAEVNGPRNAVGRSVDSGANPHATVASGSSTGCPQPAGFCDFNFGVKSAKQARSNFDFLFFTHVQFGGSDLFTKAIGAAFSGKNGKGEEIYG